MVRTHLQSLARSGGSSVHALACKPPELIQELHRGSKPNRSSPPRGQLAQVRPGLLLGSFKTRVCRAPGREECRMRAGVGMPLLQLLVHVSAHPRDQAEAAVATPTAASQRFRSLASRTRRPGAAAQRPRSAGGGAVRCSKRLKRRPRLNARLRARCRVKMVRPSCLKLYCRAALATEPETLMCRRLWCPLRHYQSQEDVSQTLLPLNSRRSRGGATPAWAVRHPARRSALHRELLPNPRQLVDVALHHLQRCGCAANRRQRQIQPAVEHELHGVRVGLGLLDPRHVL